MVANGGHARRWGAYAALGIACALVLGPLTPQAIAHANSSEPKSDSASNKQAQAELGSPINASPSAGNETGADSEKNPPKPHPLTIKDHLWRWIWRLFRDPIAVGTLALFAVGGIQFGLARQTAQKQLRAYVVIGDEGGFSRVRSENKIGVKFSIVNAGQTPAYVLHYDARCEVLPFPFTGKSIFDQFPVIPNIKTAKAILTISPQNHPMGEAASDKTFTTDEIIELFSSKTDRLYCFGVIKYRDIFGKWRTTKFCRSLRSNVLLGELRSIIEGTKPGDIRERAFISETSPHDNETN